MTVLVGGCSRTGKTVLSSKLSENLISLGINTAIVKLDSWLISVDNRKQNSSVLERYELPSIISSITKVQRGETIYPPAYDAVSRRRVAEYGLDLISIKDGILFVEGVVALAIEELIKNPTLRIFVGIPDRLRKQRLVDFYSNIKRLDRKEYENIIETREKEEVPFIKRTVVNADVILMD
jgi:uridine kinase